MIRMSERGALTYRMIERGMIVDGSMKKANGTVATQTAGATTLVASAALSTTQTNDTALGYEEYQA